MEELDIQKMREAHLDFVKKVKSRPGYEEFSEQFDIEYDLAVKMCEARKAAHLTQKEIAEKMHTTQSVVSRIERGHKVTVNTLMKYAEACGKQLEINFV